MIPIGLLVLFVIGSWLYWLLACWMVRAFFRTTLPVIGGMTPPVSILKAVKGVDTQAYENYVSFCQQDYPEFELIFGVCNPADPVIPVIERLMREFPNTGIRLFVVPAIRPNRKASILHQLSIEARYEVLVVSDSDMRVTPDYLRRVVAPLNDERVGLVTCPYRGASLQSIPACLEALYVGTTFIPAVILARFFIDMRFAMGASVALRRKDLNRIGGFAALADYLADDYQLGARIASLGMRVHLSEYIISSIIGAATFQDQWHREIRWARCARVSRPLEYPGFFLGFSTPMSVILVLFTGFAVWAQVILGVSLLVRWLSAWWVTEYTRDRGLRHWFIWLPVRDLLSALVWSAAITGRRVIWRGEEFVLQSDGRMQPITTSSQVHDTIG